MNGTLVMIVTFCSLVFLFTGCYYDPWTSCRYVSDSEVGGGSSWRLAKQRKSGIAFSVWMASTYRKGSYSGPYTLLLQARDVEGNLQSCSATIREIFIKRGDRKSIVFRDGNARPVKVAYDGYPKCVKYSMPECLDPNDGEKLFAEFHVEVVRHGQMDNKTKVEDVVIYVTFTPEVLTGKFQWAL